jgi:hypothetical protein
VDASRHAPDRDHARDLSSNFSATYRRFVAGKSARSMREDVPAHACGVLFDFYKIQEVPMPQA